MAKMRITRFAHNFSSLHEEAAICLRLDVLLIYWRPKTRPSRARIELGIWAKQVVAATDALVNPLLMIVPVKSREWCFSSFLSSNLELLGSEQLLPFFLGLFLAFDNHVSHFGLWKLSIGKHRKMGFQEYLSYPNLPPNRIIQVWVWCQSGIIWYKC